MTTVVKNNNIDDINIKSQTGIDMVGVLTQSSSGCKPMQVDDNSLIPLIEIIYKCFTFYPKFV